MSKSNGGARRAVALQYGTEHSAPVIIASGMGNLAEKIVEVASENGSPRYGERSLSTVDAPTLRRPSYLKAVIGIPSHHAPSDEAAAAPDRARSSMRMVRRTVLAVFFIGVSPSSILSDCTDSFY